MRKKSLPAEKREKATGGEIGANRGRLRFHYIKSNYFRVIHSDGVFGGVTPSLGLQVAFFSQRVPIPQVMVHEHDLATHALGEELPAERVTKDGLVREVEVNVLMDLGEAKKLLGWLTTKVKELEQARKEVDVAPTTVAAKGPKKRQKR